MEGVGEGHRISIGWLDGIFSLAYFARCGRWRSTKGRGLLGNCDPTKAPTTRLNRAREGRHPETGTSFDKVTQKVPKAPGRHVLAGQEITDEELLARAGTEQLAGTGSPRVGGASDMGFDEEEVEFMEEWFGEEDVGYVDQDEPPW